MPPVPGEPPVALGASLRGTGELRAGSSCGSTPRQRGEAGRGCETRDRGTGRLFRSVLCCTPGVQRKNLFDRLSSDRPHREPRAGASHPSPHLLQLFGKGELISVTLQVQERPKDLASHVGGRRTRTSRRSAQPSQ